MIQELIEILEVFLVETKDKEGVRVVVVTHEIIAVALIVVGRNKIR